MPVLSPTTNQLQFYISDLAPEVLLRCENKTTDLTRAYVWLRDSLIEISTNPDFRNDFDELEVWTQTFNLAIGQQEYDFGNLVLVPDTINAQLDLMLWLDPPTNSVRRQLTYTSFQEADKYTTTSPSAPTSWYRFNKYFGVLPIPDQTYQVQGRAIRTHPINDNAIQQTLILLPRDWNDILIWAAVQRGYMEYLEFEKAGAIHSMLYGDPKYPNRPGLINGRKKRHEREDWRQSKPLAPIIRRYSWM